MTAATSLGRQFSPTVSAAATALPRPARPRGLRRVACLQLLGNAPSLPRCLLRAGGRLALNYTVAVPDEAVPE